MAKTVYTEPEEGCNPTMAQLARMPGYLQELYLRYWKGDDKPSDEAVAHARAQVIHEEYEVIRSKATNRFIYFVQAENGPIKIGVASNLEKRIGNLRGSSPVKLTLLFATHGGATAEANLHHRFREHRLHGEWFAPHPDILAEIERLKETANA